MEGNVVMNIGKAIKAIKLELMSDADYHRGWKDNISIGTGV